MTASVSVDSYHGSSGLTVAAITAMRMKLADNDTADTNNPMVIPASGTLYSFLKHLALVCTVAPATAINTLRAYGDGALPTGVQMFMCDNAYIDPTVQQASALAGWSNNYTGYVVGAPLTLAGSIGATTGKINTNYLQMQMGVINTAAIGVMAAETLTLSYVES